MIEVVVFPTPPFWLAIAMIFPIVIRCVRCWFGSVHVAKVRKKKCSTMFHGIFLRRMPSSSDSALHSRPTHRTRCQMQTAIRSLFHSRRTFPLARSPWQRQNSARSCRLSFSTHRHGKKTSLVSVETRQLLAQSSPLFARRSPLRSSLSLLHTRAYAHSIAFRLCLHLAGETHSKH